MILVGRVRLLDEAVSALLWGVETMGIDLLVLMVSSASTISEANRFAVVVVSWMSIVPTWLSGHFIVELTDQAASWPGWC